MVPVVTCGDTSPVTTMVIQVVIISEIGKNGNLFCITRLVIQKVTCKVTAAAPKCHHFGDISITVMFSAVLDGRFEG